MNIGNGQKKVFLINLIDKKWYNGQSINNSQGYLNDKVNRLIGWATMRQLRVKSGQLSIIDLLKIKIFDYNFYLDTCRVKSTIQSLIPNYICKFSINCIYK